jgi:glycosyltransferase involved in cell wall biosynthesis
MPLNVITHGFLFRDRARMLSLAAFDNVRFLCLSETIRRRCVVAFGVPEARALNTTYGVDVRFFRPSSTFGLEPTIVSAGAAQRDYRTLLNAVAGIGAKVAIAADSAWSSHVGAVRPDSLPSNVSFGSCGNYINLRNLYDAATFVVVPLYDVPRACGYAVISEAMAMGRAVIATKTQCHSDMLVDGVTGFYVEPGDAEQLRNRITLLLENRQLAEKMGTAARARVCELFSVDRYCDRLAAAVYDLRQYL